MMFDMEKALAIVDKLIEDGLVDAINDMTKCFYPENWFKDYAALDLSYKIYSGASKGVIVFDETDWVIKFDYYHDGTSYCELEVKHYKLAIEAGLERYFAKTLMLRKIGNTSFTIQEKCKCDEDEVMDRVYDSVKRRREELCEELDNDDIWDEVNLICEDGEAYCIFEDAALNQFIRYHYINDLHQANFGKIGDRYVMIDYSGF